MMRLSLYSAACGIGQSAVTQIGQINGKNGFGSTVPVTMEYVGTENGLSSVSERQQDNKEELLDVHSDSEQQGNFKLSYWWDSLEGLSIIKLIIRALNCE